MREDWVVDFPEASDQLDHWATEDVTPTSAKPGRVIFSAGGRFTTPSERFQDVGNLLLHQSSLAHETRFTVSSSRLHVLAGFHQPCFYPRVCTQEVVTPGETRRMQWRAEWVDERRAIFLDAIAMLDLGWWRHPSTGQPGADACRPGDAVFLFLAGCLGPCRSNTTTSTPYEFLVPASRLAATMASQPAGAGLSHRIFRPGIDAFAAVQPGAKTVLPLFGIARWVNCPKRWRLSRHRAVSTVPLCEFQRKELMPEGEDASAIIGIVWHSRGFQLGLAHARPLPEDHMAGWLSDCWDIT